ncbi:MAG: Fur family transcriptional regulator [Candidatus Saccharibacteria bacterium]|nr:Fur family transcriptional regulator [Candidatus Saccharibacteria bacterium]
MDNSIELLEKTLRKNNVFVTNARKTVFLALLNSEPRTMQELESRINSKINRTSIYRVIELFIGLGIVHKIQIGWKYKIELSDIFIEHHHHISCIKCGKLISVHEHGEIERFINKVTQKYGYTNTSHQLEIQGVCSNCKIIRAR